MPLTRRSGRARVVSGAAALLLAGSIVAIAACGARSELTTPPAAPPCNTVADCPDFGDKCKTIACTAGAEPDGGAPSLDSPGGCVTLATVDCDDHDPCTTDTCEPTTGACSHPHVTPDADGDGAYAPLPGHVAGDPGSCGTDCDDTNPNVHPGATEVCDGIDNDCNGVVDDGAQFVASGEDAVRISGDIEPASMGALAYGGGNYAAVYWGMDSSGFQVFSQLLSPAGGSVAPGEQPIDDVNGDAQGGPVVWSGDRFGVAWSDRRTGDYEIYFAGLQPDAKKIAPGDVQLTSAEGFSVNPTLVWTGSEFIAAWQDDRSGTFSILAQRVGLEGTPVGGNVAITGPTVESGISDESPQIANGLTELGFTWGRILGASQVIQFQVVPRDLSAATSPVVTLTDGTTEAVYPVVAWNKDRFIVAWYDRTANPAAIYAAAVDEKGDVLVKARAITQPGSAHSRYPVLLPLGDRILLVYSDDRDNDGGYEIYSRTVTPDLEPLSAETRVTHSAGDSVEPAAAFGPNGDLGILFRDDRDGGGHDLYFTRLSCATPTAP